MSSAKIPGSDTDDTDSAAIRGGTDGTLIGNVSDALKVSAAQSGTWNLTNISGTVSLPTGAATETTLSALNGKIPSGLTVTSTRLLVDGSGVTQPVSGTVTANQGGTWNITNISGTISLPTGAATSALQTTGNTSLSTIATALTLAQGSTTSGQTGALTLAAVTTAAPSYTTGQTSPLSLTIAGALRVDGSAVNQPIALTSSAVTSGSLTATNQLVQLNGVFNSYWIYISGSWAGSLTAERSDDGTNGWTSCPMFDASADFIYNAVTANAQVRVAGGPGFFRIRAALITSGSASVQIVGSLGINTVSVTNQSASSLKAVVQLEDSSGNTITHGQNTMANSLPVVIASDQSAIPVSQSGTWNLTNISGTISLPTGAATSALQTTGNTSLASIVTALTLAQGSTTSGQTGSLTLGAVTTAAPSYTNAQTSPLSLTPAGALRVDGSGVTQPVSGSVTSVPGDGTKQSYSAAATGIVTVANATDVFTITGSATKTVRITTISVSGTTTAGSGASIPLAIIKRSTADSSGTPATSTNVPHDSNNAAATAVVKSYTANPTLGTAVGTIRSARLEIPAVGGTEQPVTYDFGTRPAQAVVLRGTSEQLCINFGGSVTITTPVISFDVEWTEE